MSRRANGSCSECSSAKTGQIHVGILRVKVILRSTSTMGVRTLETPASMADVPDEAPKLKSTNQGFLQRRVQILVTLERQKILYTREPGELGALGRCELCNFGSKYLVDAAKESVHQWLVTLTQQQVEAGHHIEGRVSDQIDVRLRAATVLGTKHDGRRCKEGGSRWSTVPRHEEYLMP